MNDMTREQALQVAFLQAIRLVGMASLKSTSMFGSSERLAEAKQAA